MRGIVLQPPEIPAAALPPQHGGMNTPAAHRPLRHARDYAQAIVDAHGNVERQREIFAACPQVWRAQARELAKSALARLERQVEHMTELRRRLQPSPQQSVAHSAAPATPFRKSSPEVGRHYLTAIRAALAHQERT